MKDDKLRDLALILFLHLEGYKKDELIIKLAKIIEFPKVGNEQDSKNK